VWISGRAHEVIDDMEQTTAKLNTEVLRFAQNDDIKQATATTGTKADP
jgi:hypothetical protein